MYKKLYKHTKNLENWSQIECFMSQKPLATNFIQETVYIYIWSVCVRIAKIKVSNFQKKIVRYRKLMILFIKRMV